MKRRLLIGFCVVLVVIGGIIAGRVRARPNVRTNATALTIVSKVTDYGTDGSILGVYTQVRRQYSDGTWKVHLDVPGKKAFDSSGRIDVSRLLSADVYAAGALSAGQKEGQFLGYTVYVQTDPNGTEFWYAPELDTMLKEVVYSKKDGKLDTVVEAISIQLGEPD